MTETEAKLLYPGVHIIDIIENNDEIIVNGKTTTKETECTFCGCYANKLSSFWIKTIQDVPYNKKNVILKVKTKIFLCPNPECSKRAFAERFEFCGIRQKKTYRLLEKIISITEQHPYRKAALILIDEGLKINDSTVNKIEKRNRRKGQQ